VREERNDVRPDFRICEQTLELDCSLLEHMTAHTANAPALGGVGKPVFGVAPRKDKAFVTSCSCLQPRRDNRWLPSTAA
jgi:hypothetical protein